MLNRRALLAAVPPVLAAASAPALASPPDPWDALCRGTLAGYANGPAVVERARDAGCDLAELSSITLGPIKGDPSYPILVFGDWSRGDHIIVTPSTCGRYQSFER